VSAKRQLGIAKKLLTQFTLSRAVGNYPVGELSGGNQQKVVLSKLLHADPKVLLIDEPTRGIDVAAKVEVLQAIRRFAEEKQRAVIVTSTEIEEVIEVADRIVVMSSGRVVGELDNATEHVALQDVLDLAFGVNLED
jgi:ABC-type sugar transport system ATPase subunit